MTLQPSPGLPPSPGYGAASRPPSPVPSGEGLAGPEAGAPMTRLSVQVVEHLHRLVGGEARVEDMVLRFIADRYHAANLLYLPASVAREIVKRPADFIQAAKRHCEPELSF